ncbi:hypothetical protein [Rhodanobacter thiooxydans]|uniref:hypothetical protein n=1 Tax=Rhodanobacter thiooxydans TaxID=416169 RepID=UPI000260FFD2|nr:hypothetical protein [Rhodanobacter thiooxydans]EIL98863.1 hypothetical protein UUA_10631 [Rhodanobacter thiooxydans LCS2]MCW0201191.1 hypothetical protein [Rhodanobacter thiooxydans]
MKLLRDSVLLRTLRRLLVGRRKAVRAPYTITVPAPLERPAGSSVVELPRRADAGERAASTQQARLPSSGHLALVSSR